MRSILCFKNLDEDNADQCSCGEDLRETLINYHDELVGRVKAVCASGEKEESEEKTEEEPAKPWTQRLMNIVKMVKAADQEPEKEEKEGPRPEGKINIFIGGFLLFLNILYACCSNILIYCCH